MRIPSFHASRAARSVVAAAARSANFVFGIFWTREVIIDRFDSTDSATTTTARRWFIG